MTAPCTKVARKGGFPLLSDVMIGVLDVIGIGWGVGGDQTMKLRRKY